MQPTREHCCEHEIRCDHFRGRAITAERECEQLTREKTELLHLLDEAHERLGRASLQLEEYRDLEVTRARAVKSDVVDPREPRA